MTTIGSPPFEFPSRWTDFFTDFDIPLEVAVRLEERDRELEDFIGRESVPVDQQGAVTVAESNDYPCRIGGSPRFVVTLLEALTTVGELQFSKNGTVFATEVLATTVTEQDFGPWEGVTFAPRDRARVAITDAGAGGSGFHGEWWFGG